MQAAINQLFRLKLQTSSEFYLLATSRDFSLPMKPKRRSLLVVALFVIQGVGLSAPANAAPTITISNVTLAKQLFLVSEEIVVSLKVISTNGTKHVSGQITAPSGGFSGSSGQLVSGTDKDGTYRITFTLASFAEIGNYRIDLYASSAESLISSASGGNFQVYASMEAKTAADKAAADKAAADKAAADKAAADKAAADKAAADKAATEAKAKAEAEAKVAKKKTTTTCTKGKQVKRVTAVKPSCPAGYKKK
jgi:hypothetical protein